MFQDQYTKLKSEDVTPTLQSFNPLLDGSPFPDTSVIMRRTLSFYPDHWFYDVADHQTMPPRRRFLIVKDQSIIVLDGKAETILSLNSAVPPILNDQNIHDYIQFYLAFVRGIYGRMILIESLDDIPWRDEPSPAARKAIGKMVHAMEPTRSITGAYHTKAQMIFNDGLYEVDLHVSKGGVIEFKDPQMLVEDMPVLDDVLGP
jgi:hypothetical protein